jgi:hypothetical protein
MMNATEERKARARANEVLHAIGRRYHDGLALAEIDAALTVNGFGALEPAIYCGRDGSVNEQVGERTWLAMQWHKMETGTYEINAYLS